jgi:Tol biopolymer transport system component
VNSKRTGDFEHYLLAVDRSRTVSLWYQNRPGFVKDWSPDAAYLLVAREVDGKGDILITDREGENWQPIAVTEANEIEPRWSPIGEDILYQSDQDGNQEIYLVEVSGGDPVNLTQNPAEDKRASWAMDGTRIVFTSNRDGRYGLYRMNPDGSDLSLIAQNPSCGFKYLLSPDGEHIIYATDSFYLEDGWDNEMVECRTTSQNLASLTGGNLTTIEVNETGKPQWSPDGSRLLFYGPQDIDSGSQSLYTIRADGSGLVDLTPPSNDMFMATWSSDGTRVAQVESYYVEGQGTIQVLTVTNADGSNRYELAAVPWDPDYVVAFRGFSWP